MKRPEWSNSAFFIALFCTLLVASPLFSPVMADEKEVTVPIEQVVKTAKLSAEQLTKAEVTVPISWVSEEYLETQGFTVSSQQTEEEPVTAPNNIPNGTYTREPKITSDQNESIEISTLRFEFTYDQGDLKESTVNFTISSDNGKIEMVDLLLEKQHKLTPKDGSFDSTKEKFSATLDTLNEGNLYRGKIKVSTKNGSDTVEFEVYPRQFLNIADDDEIRVCTHYYIWYSEPGSTLGADWEGEYRSAFEPSLGKYESRNDQVIAKHIDWATGHGMDTFIVGWWGTYGMNRSLQAFRENILFDEIDYFINWDALSSGIKRTKSGLYDFSDEEVATKFKKDMKYIVDNLIDDKNYFQIEGSPVIYLYDEERYVGPLKEVLGAVEDWDNAPDDIFWIGDNDEPFESERKERRIMDAINDYNSLVHWYPRDKWTLNERYLEKRYTPFIFENYFETVESENYYIPTIVPGFNKPASNMQMVERTPQGFRDQIQQAKKVIDGDIKTVFITSFNEWMESTSVEPAKKWGFEYLNIIKEEFTGYLPDEELKDELDHIELRFNETVSPDGGPREMSARFATIRFSESPQSRNTDFEIELGSEGQLKYFGRGWYGPEGGNGRAWRWSSHVGESSIFIPMTKDLNYMKFEAVPISDGIEADIYLNGKLVDHIDFEKGWQTYTVELSN